jgi:hypothetical protein
MSVLTLARLPVLMAAQAMSWWLYRQRPDRPMPVYW